MVIALASAGDVDRFFFRLFVAFGSRLLGQERSARSEACCSEQDEGETLQQPAFHRGYDAPLVNFLPAFIAFAHHHFMLKASHRLRRRSLFFGPYFPF